MQTRSNASLDSSPGPRQVAVRLILDALFLCFFFGLLSLPMMVK